MDMRKAQRVYQRVKPSPLGEGGRRPDEGRRYRGHPLPGNHGKSAPHQSASRTASPSGGSLFAAQHLAKLREFWYTVISRIKKVIGVVSGKGGVGKSMTSAMLAVSMRRLGYKAGVLDADITGPSIPRLFGVKGPATGDGESINPICSRTGVEIMSINLLLDDPEAPVVWRGPVIAGAVKQFWQEVVWDVDFLFVDMPPGTGDVPLTVFQTLPVDGIVIVSSPQELVGMIVGKAVQMAQMMHVPILGLVENMSYAVCPDCGKHIHVFGDSHVDEIADKYSLPVLAKMPIDPELAKEADAGMIEVFAGDYLDNAAQTVAKLLKK